jgi:uncharacterized protein YecA (UPF0149 family)
MSYQLIDEIFENYDSTITAAEAHGIAAAMLCVDNRADAGQWLAEMFADEIELSATDRQSLLSQNILILIPILVLKNLFGEEGSKDLLQDFLNQLLPPHHQIAELSFKNPEKYPVRQRT